MRFVADDDRFHHRGVSTDPRWNESNYFSLCVPEREMNGFIYVFHRPNMGFSCGGPALWDPSADNTWDCLYFDWDWPQPLDPEAEACTFTLPSSMSMRSVDPLKKYALSYDRAGYRLELEWEAACEPHEIAVSLPGMEQAGRAHYEQYGRMRGWVELHGETTPIDCWSLHDRSWGARHLVKMPRGDYAWAVADEHSAFHAAVIHDGQVDRVIGGFLVRDGEMGDLVSGVREVTKRDERGRPITTLLDATDNLGRSMHAEARCINWLQFHGYSDQFEFWCLAEWNFDGRSAYGEQQEFFPLPDVRTLVREARLP